MSVYPKTGSRDLNKLIKQAVREAGFQVLHTGGSHLKWTAPSGKFFFTSMTPSDHRAIKNIKRDLSRASDGAIA